MRASGGLADGTIGVFRWVECINQLNLCYPYGVRGGNPDKTSAAWSSTREGVPIFEEHPEGGTAKGGNVPLQTA